MMEVEPEVPVVVPKKKVQWCPTERWAKVTKVRFLGAERNKNDVEAALKDCPKDEEWVQKYLQEILDAFEKEKSIYEKAKSIYEKAAAKWSKKQERNAKVEAEIVTMLEHVGGRFAITFRDAPGGCDAMLMAGKNAAFVAIKEFFPKLVMPRFSADTLDGFFSRARGVSGVDAADLKTAFEEYKSALPPKTNKRKREEAAAEEAVVEPPAVSDAPIIKNIEDDSDAEEEGEEEEGDDEGDDEE